MKDCKKACNGVDYVLHQAALGSVMRSIKDPMSTYNANDHAFINLLVSLLICSEEEMIKLLPIATQSPILTPPIHSNKLFS